MIPPNPALEVELTLAEASLSACADPSSEVGLCVALHDAHWSALYVWTNHVALFRLRPIGVRVCGVGTRVVWSFE
jgi:hypothetical protein